MKGTHRHSTQIQRGEFMGKQKTVQKDAFADSCASIISGVISVFLFVLVMGLPLYVHDSYFDILESKFKWYSGSFLLMLGIAFVLGLVMLGIDWKEYRGEHSRKLFSGLKPQNWKQTFGPADAAVILFWLISLISTCQSRYRYEAFWGNEGRYSGLFLMTLYVAMYFVVSRFWKFQGWVIHAFLLAGMLVCGLGITDYFRMDLMGFRVRIKPEQAYIFVSTIGNINTYTAYIAVIMGAAAGIFALSEKRWEQIWSYLCMVVSFMAIIMGSSDNAYLAVGALFALLPLLLFRKKSGVVRYLVMVSTFATVMQVIDFLNHTYENTVVGLGGLFQILTDMPGLLPLTVMLWGITAVVYSCLMRRNSADSAPNATRKAVPNAAQKGTQNAEQNMQEGNEIGKWLRQTWLGLLIAVFCVIVFMAIDANVLGHGARYGRLESYLVFNDSWGTNRGYIWRKSLEVYGKFSTAHKLFGYGPDTFGILTTKSVFADMVEVTGQIFDNAHNEYLQYLVTIGPIGLLAYLVFLVSACRRMLHCNFKREYVVACALAVICYCFQAVVNLNLPITAPFLWGMLSIAIAAVRACDAEK